VVVLAVAKVHSLLIQELLVVAEDPDQEEQDVVALADLLVMMAEMDTLLTLVVEAVELEQ
tara:strand:+ start:343 stop:522 length:180 start_codon:yes stop_codon:yes gene_type:complete